MKKAILFMDPDGWSILAEHRTRPPLVSSQKGLSKVPVRRNLPMKFMKAEWQPIRKMPMANGQLFFTGNFSRGIKL